MRGSDTLGNGSGRGGCDSATVETPSPARAVRRRGDDATNVASVHERPLFKYAAAVVYVAAETPAGDQQVGTAFHVGDNMWVTARHIVDGNKSDAIATTTGSVEAYSKTLEETGGVLEGDAFSLEGGYRVVGKPMLHPDQRVDVAVLPARDQLREPPVDRCAPRQQPDCDQAAEQYQEPGGLL